MVNFYYRAPTTHVFGLSKIMAASETIGLKIGSSCRLRQYGSSLAAPESMVECWVAARAGLYSQSQACIEIDLADEPGCELSETKTLTPSVGTVQVIRITTRKPNG